MAEVKGDSVWMKVEVIAGVVVAVAAVVAFVLPAPIFGNDDDPGGGGSSSTTEVQQAPSVTGGAQIPQTGLTVSGVSGSRRLVDLPMSAGQGFATAAGAEDLRMPCGTNQSDDTYRQIEYDLPAPYRSFTTAVAPSGKADLEAYVGVQVFVRTRYDRSDRLTLVKTVTARVGQSVPLSAELANARSLLVRLTCSASTLAITLEDPRIYH